MVLRIINCFCYCVWNMGIRHVAFWMNKWYTYRINTFLSILVLPLFLTVAPNSMLSSFPGPSSVKICELSELVIANSISFQKLQLVINSAFMVEERCTFDIFYIYDFNWYTLRIFTILHWMIFKYICFLRNLISTLYFSN